MKSSERGTVSAGTVSAGAVAATGATGALAFTGTAVNTLWIVLGALTLVFAGLALLRIAPRREA
jgi:hypothetical protein